MRRQPSRSRAVAAGCAVTTMLAGLVLGATSASARFHEVPGNGVPGYLVLRSDPWAPHWADFRPGDRAYWHLEAALTDADRAELRVEIRAEVGPQELPGLTVAVTACDEPFEGAVSRNPAEPPRCAHPPVAVLPTLVAVEVAAHPGDYAVDLTDLHAGVPRYLLVEIARPELSTPGGSARIGIGVHASGADLSPAQDLPPTGAQTWGRELVAMGLVLVGALILALTRRRA